MVRNPAGITVGRETVEVWARYAGDCRRLRCVNLAKVRNVSPKTQKNDNDNAIRKIINNHMKHINVMYTRKKNKKNKNKKHKNTKKGRKKSKDKKKKEEMKQT